MCGEHTAAGPVTVTAKGSSPHVRGARGYRLRLLHLRGIIPACAGSTLHEVFGGEFVGDHPRMCGEHPPIRPAKRRLEGSSPHVRGAHAILIAASGSHGIIPACAGST